MLLGTVLVLFLLGGVGQASAHAALSGTDPADGSVLKTAPRAVTLTFTESVGLLDDSFRVLDPSSHRVRTGKAEHADGRSDTARVTLPAGLADGTFTVAWRVVSADSHPVSGAFTFSVGEPSATTAKVSAGPVEDPLTGGLYGAARYAAYLAAALLIGTALFITVCRPADVRPLRAPLRIGWWALTGSTLLLLLLRAPYETGEGPLGAFTSDALGRTLGSRPGQALVARLMLLAAGALLLVRARVSRPRTAAGAAVAVALALTWAAAEHASAGIQVPAAMTSSVLHLLAMAAWLGGLAALLVLLRRAPRALSVDTVARFSRLATASVSVLAVTGVYQSWRGLGTLTALTETSYGRLLLAKLVAVGLLVVVGTWSRGVVGRWAMARAEVRTVSVEEVKVPERVGGGVTVAPTAVADGDGGEDAHRTALRRSVLIEVVVSAVVLMLTTVLTGTAPGRAQAEAQTVRQAAALPATSVTMVPFRVGRAGGKVQVTLDPGRVGDNAIEAVVYGPDGGLATVPELRISFTLPTRDIGPLQGGVTDRGGYWATNAVNLPIAGTWTMKVTVRVSETDQVSVERPVRIEP